MKINFLIFLAILLNVACSEKEETPIEEETPKITIEGISIAETNTNFPIYLNIRLSAVTSETVTANLKSRDGTATETEDYIALDEIITFEPNQTQINVRVDIVGDEAFESEEAFYVDISNAENATIQTATAEITIQNDDLNTDFTIPQTGFTSPTSYAGMNMLWSDEFDEDENLLENWTFEIGNGNSGWGNNELQYYRAENTSLVDGYLVIEAREENFGGRNYTSSRMITKGKFDFKYGRVDIRAALPYGQGIWPALWMLGSNFENVGWPSCGEIDIMEMLGHEPNTLHGTTHWSNENDAHTFLTGTTILDAGTFNDEFHVFSIIWNENQIQWLLDDEVYHTIAINASSFSEFREEFFFIFNVAVGGNWPGSPDATTSFSQRMIVDYIRVFQN